MTYEEQVQLIEEMHEQGLTKTLDIKDFFKPEYYDINIIKPVGWIQCIIE